MGTLQGALLVLIERLFDNLIQSSDSNRERRAGGGHLAWGCLSECW